MRSDLDAKINHNILRDHRLLDSNAREQLLHPFIWQELKSLLLAVGPRPNSNIRLEIRAPECHPPESSRPRFRHHRRLHPPTSTRPTLSLLLKLVSGLSPHTAIPKNLLPLFMTLLLQHTTLTQPRPTLLQCIPLTSNLAQQALRHPTWHHHPLQAPAARLIHHIKPTTPTHSSLNRHLTVTFTMHLVMRLRSLPVMRLPSQVLRLAVQVS